MRASTIGSSEQPVAGLPSVRSLRRRLKVARRGHSDRTLLSSAETLYSWSLMLLILGAVIVSATRTLWGDLTECASAAAACHATRDLLPGLLMLALLAIGLRFAVVLGPVVASRPAASWLLSTPLDRRGLLARSLTAALGVGAGTGAVLGAAAYGLSTWSIQAMVLGGWLGAALGTLGVGLAAGAQPDPRRRTAVGRSGGILAVPVVLGAALLTIGVDASVSGWNAPSLVVPIAAVATVLAAIAVAWARRSAARLWIRDVVVGGDLLNGLGGAALAMDASLLADLVRARRFRLMGARPARRGHGSGPIALASRELFRTFRTPGRLVVSLALLAVPYLLARLEVTTLVPIGAMIAAYFAVRPFLAGLHTVEGSTGLRRAMPYSRTVLRVALAAPGMVAGLLWSLAAAPASALAGTPVAWWTMWPTVAVVATAGAVSTATKPPISFDGPLISTPAGALPAGFAAQFMGPVILLVIGMLPLVFGFPWWLAYAVAAGVAAFALLRGTKTGGVAPFDPPGDGAAK